MKRNVLDTCLSRRAMLHGAAAFGLGLPCLNSFINAGSAFAQDASDPIKIGALYNVSGLPSIDVGGTAPVITSIGNNVFMLPFGDNVQASAGAEYAASKGWKTCAVLYDEMNTYPSVLASYFKDRWLMSDLGGIVLAEASFHPDDEDVISQVARIQAMSPDADFLFASAMPDRIGSIVEQA